MESVKETNVTGTINVTGTTDVTGTQELNEYERLQKDLSPIATFLVRTTNTTPAKIKQDLDLYFGGDVIDISTSNEYYMTEEIKTYSIDINHTTPKLIEFVDNNPGVWNYQEVQNYSISINTVWREDWDKDVEMRYKILDQYKV
jgi:hypothetical protein